MRGQDRRGLSALRRSWVLAAAPAGLFAVALAATAQESGPITIVPRLTGAADPMSEAPILPLSRPIVDDIKRARNFPEQPPVIPHSIDGYQLTLSTNRCLSCHAPEFTEASGAPMVSLTHFTDRDGEVLAEVAPRRYFCTACHVPQTDARPLVLNRFRYPNAGGKE
jgi:cytochrome c-type protein NapB